METIKPGDLVTLKSGSPTMTVQFKNANEQWYCTYFSKAKSDFVSGAFSEESLVIYK